MKSFLRTIVFVILAINFCQSIIGAFVFGKEFIKPYSLFILALSILFLLMKSIFKTISLPEKGVGYVFLATFMTLIVLMVLVYLLPSFAITAVTLKKLIIFGVVIPSTKLTSFQATLVSAILISFAFHFFDWLCSKK